MKRCFDFADGFSQSRNRCSDAEAVVTYSESRRTAIITKGADFSAPFVMVMPESRRQRD
ncbi:MAG: hypothetical protein J6V80_04435 [Clostridia bacterium]|nr:hypothetical protein [Clostridia bacterium]